MKLTIAVFLGTCLSLSWAAVPFLVYGPPAPTPLQPDAGAPSRQADLREPQPPVSDDIQNPLPEAPEDIQNPVPDTDSPVGLTDVFEPQQPDLPDAPVENQEPLPGDIQNPLPDTDFLEPQQPDLPEVSVDLQKPLPEAPLDIQSPKPDAHIDIHGPQPVVILDRPLLVLRDDQGQYSVGLENKGPDGQTLTERGRLITTNGGWEYVIAKSGSYSYTSPEGIPVSVEWEADHNGFRIIRSSV